MKPAHSPPPLEKPSRRMVLQGGAAGALRRGGLADRLRKEVRGEVLFDAASRGRYATDASIYQRMPLGVVVPETSLDLRLALEVARDAGVPVLSRGGGTSQCGQTVGEALVIDTSRHLRKMLSLNLEAGEVTVEPGMVLDHLNQALKPHGVWFPVDVSTAAQCTIGGMTGNNSCGSRSLHYGNMVHNVRAIDAILDDGTLARFAAFGDGAEMQLNSQRLRALVSRLHEIAQQVAPEIRALWPKVMRRVGGYNLDIFDPQSERPYTPDGRVNLAHLLVGSEGTLATFESIRLALAPIPRAKVLGVVNFPTFQKAMEVTPSIVGLKPVAVELVDRTMIELCRVNPVFAPVIQDALVNVGGRETDALLLVEFAGEDLERLVRDLLALEELMGDLGLPGSVVSMRDPKRQAALWEVRKAGLNIMMSLKGDGKPVSFIEDCAVPLEHLADYTASLSEVFARHGTQGTWYAHASVGTLHVRPILDMRRDGAEKMRAIAEEAAALVRKFKGAFSGEHGDGLVRSEWVGWQFGPDITRAFEAVKDAFDPKNRLNPGKIVRATRMDDRSLFRFPPNYRVTPLKTGLDWSAWDVQNDPSVRGDPGTMGIQIGPPGSGDDPSGGLSKAVEMCNNNGHCRKFDAGVMCPSYRVTREELHSVRGRANTLRLALSGQLPNDLAGPEVAEAMDLCVGCKACKRECPTGVDMARMKIEAAHQRGLRHGFAFRDRLVASLPDLAQRVHRTPALGAMLNLRNQWPWLARLLEPITGVAASRPLPEWASASFRQQAQDDAAAGVWASLEACDVVLWADTFNSAYSPEALMALGQLMRQAGYRVALSGAAAAKPLCCGRTALSVGDVDGARRRAVAVLDALAPVLASGVPVVGVEPSCVLGFQDEWQTMNLGPRAEQLGRQAKLFESWWMSELAQGHLKPPAVGDGRAVYVHGHCHQKALGAWSPTIETLRSVGFEVHPIESSCCGMAGAFGYDPQHQEVSKAMAQASLVPAVASAPADAWIVADGFSCRHQIQDLAGRTPITAAQAIAKAWLGS